MSRDSPCNKIYRLYQVTEYKNLNTQFKTGSMMDHSVSVTAALRADFGCGSVLYEKRNYRCLANNIGPKSSPTITYEDHKFRLTGAPQTAAQKPPIIEVVVNGWVSARWMRILALGGWSPITFVSYVPPVPIGAEALVRWPSEDPERVDSLWEVVKTKSNVGDKKPVPPNYSAPNISLPTTRRASSVFPTVPAVPGKVGKDGRARRPSFLKTAVLAQMGYSGRQLQGPTVIRRAPRSSAGLWALHGVPSVSRTLFPN
ncbi:hypothetical protein HOY82DRAFT_540870 [Tuber indicum]|nr:hypothetical protein HOY82DRAFT_540870 [Tuber indicum]